ncbi:hypothetical protein AK812_SmicGene19814 [Symbiodinium microadriaticum]|uniref:EF-hand domain-containing protein n=1 Tax=Symbiodinium microadriaticum TaxID=2951 RepID=A0A1Q9DRN5_SYMMI|nr:hypothetical protein AK812_SmicGene19814 [Symbiodinium microadriaticum]
MVLRKAKAAPKRHAGALAGEAKQDSNILLPKHPTALWNYDKMSMEDAMALFRRFDVNGNGTLGFDELRELLLIVGVPAADIPGLFGIIDTNADGDARPASADFAPVLQTFD